VDVSVLISTFNRCGLLAGTLDSQAVMTVPADLRWEVIVVDNNSTDGTRSVVESRKQTFPVPLRYLFEPRQGKSYALNTGLAASTARVIAFTDDDVQVEPGWLEAAARPLLAQADFHYTGGPVLPLWEVTPPAWFDAESGVLRGPLALLDYGAQPFVFEDRRLIPVGVNMAVCRSAIDGVGGFHSAMDRRGTSLLGQGQAEFFFRIRAAGFRGLYVPTMRVRHHAPASRTRLQYYLRWWYWKGVARARMEAWHPISELGLDLATVPRFAGLPRFMWRSAAEDVWGWLRAIARRDSVRQIEHEVMLAYCVGYFVGRRYRTAGQDPGISPVAPGDPEREPERCRETGAAPPLKEARELS
jgi:glycosyltransferase involved in cell wall biosynthesis